MSYFIIDTYNGQGYSESGIINHEDDIKDARVVALQAFNDAYMFQPSDVEFKVVNALHNEGDMYISFDDGDDQGAIHVKKSKADTYGFIIQPDINDVSALDKSDFDECINSLEKDGEFLKELASDGITFAQWLIDLMEDGSNAAHTDNGYLIVYKTA